jgi:plasmid rolling circle replication initiator protein Rep
VVVNIEFSNKILKAMLDKQQFNIKYSKWYYGFSEEYKAMGLPRRANTLKKRSDRVGSCMNLWIWDLYRKNKLLDLQKVNRCMDNRFCPNCRKFSLAMAIHNLRIPFNDLLLSGYNPYLLTLTIPNVEGIALHDTIDKLYKSFTKFYYYYSKDNRMGYKGRYMKFEGALKVLEITCNAKDGTYHPHLHVMIFSKDYNPLLFNKYIKGEWSNKRNKFNYYSDMDMQIRKLWTMAYNNISCSVKHFEEQEELYLCDIKEMDQEGIYEVLKYTFKDTDIKTYRNFKDIFIALEGRRIRQGYGLLYNLKVDGEETDGEKLELDLIEKENPEQILTREIKPLITSYAEYRKVSRFKSYRELENLD